MEGKEEVKFCIYARPKIAGYHQDLPSGALPKEFSVKASCCGLMGYHISSDGGSSCLFLTQSHSCLPILGYKYRSFTQNEFLPLHEGHTVCHETKI